MTYRNSPIVWLVMTHAEQFLAEVEAFLERSNMTASAFGKAAVNDPNFVGDLRTGRKPNLGLVDRVHEFIKSQEEAAAISSEQAAAE